MTLNKKCPACRTPYDPQNYKFTPPDEQAIAQHKSEKKRKAKEKKKPQSEKELPNVKNLVNIRVIQRNLVYITNLALSIAKEEYLRKYEYLGQYGKIEKIVINKNNLYSVNSPHGPSVSAYVTFASKKDALACIQAIDQYWLENRALRASFGTTKYCTFFLRNLPCNNPDCMYLHEVGKESDSFTKEEIANGKHNFYDEDTNEPELTEEELEELHKGRVTILPPRTTRPEIPNDSSEDPTVNSKDSDSSVDGMIIQPQKSISHSTPAIVPPTTKLGPASGSTLTQSINGTANAPLRQSERSGLPPSASWAQSTKVKDTPVADSKDVWGTPPGLRSSQTGNRENSKDQSCENPPFNYSADNRETVPAEALPELHKVSKKAESQESSQEISLSKSTSSQPSIHDRPPGIGQSEESLPSEPPGLPNRLENSSRWWEQEITSLASARDSGAWIGASSPLQGEETQPTKVSSTNLASERDSDAWAGNHSSSSSPQMKQPSKDLSTNLFEEWPELSQILEDKDEDEPVENDDEPSIPHEVNDIPSSRIFAQSPSLSSDRTPTPEKSSDSTADLSDPHQLFRSLLPNVHVSFTPGNAAQQPQRPGPNGPPPGLQARDKWNPMMGSGFPSPWQPFPPEHAPQRPHPFWPPSRPPMHTPNHPPFQAREQEPFGWHPMPPNHTQEDRRPFHPFSQQEPHPQYHPPNQRGNYEGHSISTSELFSNFAGRQNVNVPPQGMQQRPEMPNPNAGWPRSSNTFFPPPGLCNPEIPPMKQNAEQMIPQFRSMNLNFHRPEPLQQQHAFPAGFGGPNSFGQHMPPFYQQGRNPMQASESEDAAGQSQ